MDIAPSIELEEKQENEHLPPKVFTVHNLNLHYGEKHALKDINLDIYEKKVTALIGPRAAGRAPSYAASTG